MANKTYGYARVSSEEQKLSGLGMEAQASAIAAFVQYRMQAGSLPPWGGMYEDPGISGSKRFLSRPAGQRLHAALSRGDFIVFHRLDRAFRSLEDCLTMMRLWESMGVNVVILNLGGNQAVDTSSTWGKFMLHVMAAIAELERGMISDRMRAAVARIKSRGGSMNRHAPSGFRLIKGQFVPVKEKLDMAMIVVKLADKTSLSQAARLTGLSRWQVRTICRHYREHKDLYDGIYGTAMGREVDP